MNDPLSVLAPEGFHLPSPLLQDVNAAYASPGRVYHDIAHVRSVAGEFATVQREQGWTGPREVYLAVLYHDAVYVPGAVDNEAESAARARRAIVAFMPRAAVDADRVSDLIVATARHGTLGAGDADQEMALFLDCDMAILGAPPATFDAYARGIASEYAWLSKDEYRAGRGRFLARLLAAPRIFLSALFHDRLDGAARQNLARELAELGAAPPP